MGLVDWDGSANGSGVPGGVPEADVSRMTEAIRRGRVLLSVHVPHDRVDQAADILDHHGALDVDEPTERIDDTPGEVTPIRPLGPEAADAIKLKPGEGVMDKVRARERRVNVYPGFTGMGPSSNT